jgi:hypothetical protein
MGAHLETAEAIETINKRLPTGASLIYVSSYYGDGGFGVYEHAGFFRSDIRLRYANTVGDGPEVPINSYDIRKSRLSRAEAKGAYAFYSLPFPARPIEGMERLGPRIFKIP